MKKDKNEIFAELYQQHASYMYGVCLRYTKDADDAKDVMQDGFIKIFQMLDSFRGESNIKTWMRKIMVNTAINFYRHKKIIHFEDIAQHSHHNAPVFQETALEKMSADELLDLIRQIPAGYKMVFNLYEIEGYKHKEIAEMLGISEGTSKSQLFKAKNLLQDLAEQKYKITASSLGIKNKVL